MTNSKKNLKLNRGFSLVEVLVALAIFMILMFPLVGAITRSIHSTTTAKELQYRNDFAEGLMEQMKSVPIDDIKDSSVVENIIKELGAEDLTSYTFNPANNKMSAEGVVYLKIPKAKEEQKYSYHVEVSNEDYESLFPAKSPSGYVESLDKDKVALIDGAALGNYDDYAFKALFTKYLAGKQSSDTYDETAALAAYDNVTAKREIEIVVTKKTGNIYEVNSTVKYTDTSTTANSFEYNIYHKEFKDELPSIYLMYNVGVYNRNYTVDSIKVSLPDDDTLDPKLFVIETPENMETTPGSGVYVETRRKPERGNRSTQTLTFVSGLYSDKLKVYQNVEDSGSINTGGFNGNVYNLSEVDRNGGLYSVKVWMTEGDFSTDYVSSHNPVLKGSREGR